MMNQIAIDKPVITAKLQPLIQTITQLSWQEQLALVQIILQSLGRWWSKPELIPVAKTNNIPGWGAGKDWWTDDEFEEFQQFLADSRGHD